MKRYKINDNHKTSFFQNDVAQNADNSMEVVEALSGNINFAIVSGMEWQQEASQYSSGTVIMEGILRSVPAGATRSSYLSPVDQDVDNRMTEDGVPQPAYTEFTTQISSTDTGFPILSEENVAKYRGYVGADQIIPESVDDTKLSSAVNQTIANKVDKEAGKGLSSNDFTDEDKQALTDLVNVIHTPVGSVQAFAGLKDKIPSGWLLCDGSPVLRTSYPELFDVIGTIYGYTNSSNFLLPDLRGEFIRGFSDGKSGVDTGRTYGSAQTDALQEFGGYMNDACPSYSSFGGIFKYKTSTWGNGSTTGGDNIYRNSVQIDLDAAGIRTANETRPRNIAMNYIIKAKSTL